MLILSSCATTSHLFPPLKFPVDVVAVLAVVVVIVVVVSCWLAKTGDLSVAP